MAKIKLTMNLTVALKKLSDYMSRRDVDGYNACLKTLYASSTAEDKEAITRFVEAELEKSTRNVASNVRDVQIRVQLGDAVDFLPLSYIAGKYFNRTRQWLYQRINGNTVSGRPAQFSASEIETFNFALQDISKKISSLAIRP
jgi:hypothetical protein